MTDKGHRPRLVCRQFAKRVDPAALTDQDQQVSMDELNPVDYALQISDNRQVEISNKTSFMDFDYWHNGGWE